MTVTATPPASRLHHNAYVAKNLEETRAFYEDIIGLPLVATYTEIDELWGKERVYCHCFFGIGDGGALAFFQFAKPEDEALFVPDFPETPFVHIALNVDAETQDAIKARVEAAGIQPPQTYQLEHGYCRSFYVIDPNGMTVEFTHDATPAVAPEYLEHKRATARDELKRWLNGDHSNNNQFRHAEAAE